MNVDYVVGAANVVLRPVERGDVAFLHELWRSQPALCGVRRPLGAVPERVLEAVLHDDFLSLLVEAVGGNGIADRLGHVSLFDVDWHDRHAQLGATFIESAGTGQIALALLAFLASAFSDLPLRKIYVRTVPLVYESLPVDLREVMVEEGRLEAHEYRTGTYVDHVISAIYQESVCGT